MGLTILGMVINTISELRIIDNAEVLPVIAIWSVMNAIVLFFVCMMSLQARCARRRASGNRRDDLDLRRQRRHFDSTHQRHIAFGPGSGADVDRALSAGIGDTMRVFVTEVGFVAGTVVRQIGRFLGVEFIYPIGRAGPVDPKAFYRRPRYTYVLPLDGRLPARYFRAFGRRARIC